MSTHANPSKVGFTAPTASVQRVKALTRAAGRLSGRFHRQIMLPQLAEQVRARVCKSGLARLVVRVTCCLPSHCPCPRLLSSRRSGTRGNRVVPLFYRASMMSLQKCFNSSFGCNSVSAVVSGSYCRCLRKPFAVKAAMESTEGRPSAGGRADRECVYSYPSRTLPNYVLSSGAVPNYDKPMFVVNQLALMEVGISTLVIHTSTKLAAPCLGSFSNSWT